MHPAVRYGALLLKDVQRPLAARVIGAQQVPFPSIAVRTIGSWTCRNCQSALTRRDQSSVDGVPQSTLLHTLRRKRFSTSTRRLDSGDKNEKEQSTTIHLQPPPPSDEKSVPSPQTEPVVLQAPSTPDDAPISPEPTSSGAASTPTPTEPPSTPQPRAAPADEPLSTPASRSSSLPSAFAHRRTEISRRASHMMDNFLTKATLASQQINTYTGTDFSGIEALRTEIVAQEKQVKSRHAAVNTQKDRHMEAHVKQASSQKEIVSLLERKSSWSPSDLERYMTLVRSEHLDEQAVQKAKEDLAEAERDLEDSRAMLEKLERKQYHEEQIWSDTIRRNSTWVTIGLMGVNIFLLLAQIIFFEPYRRRKIVREMKAALDERSMAGPGLVPTAATPEVVAQADLAENARDVPVEVVEAEAKVEPAPLVEQPVAPIVPAEASVDPAEATTATTEEAVPVGDAVLSDDSPVSTWKQLEHATSWEQRFEISKATVLDLFSDRLVHVKKVDVTTIALEGAAAGIATMGVLFLLLRPQ